MPVISAIDVRNKIVGLIADIKTENQFNNTLGATNVHKVLAPVLMNDKSESAYPKIFVIIDGGDFEHFPTQTVVRSVSFLIIGVVRRLSTDTVPVSEKSDLLYADIERQLMDRSSLDGLASELTLDSYQSDGGLNDPEGLFALSITVKWRNSF